MPDRILLDINRFIVDIKHNIENTDIMSKENHRFFGKVTLCFENGKITHVEKYEVVK